MMTDSERAVLPYTRWKHHKGGTYIIVGVACGCGGAIEGQSQVVYQDERTQRLWVRGLEEFLDGRFEPIYESA